MKYSTSQYGNGQFIGDLQHVKKSLDLFIDPTQAFEIRAIFEGGGHPYVCHSIEEGLEAVRDAGSPKAIFWVLNPIDPAAKSASKKTVLCRRWMLIDIDPVRPADVSATEAEKAAACEVASQVVDYLTSLGWPAPVMTDSGNGWHLLYRVDLPNDALSQQLIRAALIHLADRLDSDTAHVDRSTHDAPRPCKLPGTWARKGPNNPERPHRMARIVFEPESIEVVTVDQLQALTGEGPRPDPESNGHGPKWSQRDGSSFSKYLQTAIDAELGRLISTPESDRNNALNRAAFALGQFADWPEMDEQATKAGLIRTGERSGLTPRESVSTVDSGWKAGKKEPRERLDPSRNGHGKTERPRKLTIGADEVEPKLVEWIWPNVLAKGFVNLFAGRTGVGKSFVLCDVAARLSRGLSFPDGSPALPVTGSLFISEDPYQYVLVPRLNELKADRRHIGFMRWEAMASYQLHDTEFLEVAWKERKEPGLIVVDPPANFLGGKDEHRNAEVRSVLMQLVTWLESRPVAMALITHYNKGSAQKVLDALDRIMGSVAWASAARVACGFVADPEDPSKCIFGGIKNNLGPKLTGLSYQIEKTEVLATVKWYGPSDTSLDDAISCLKKKTRAQNATEWLAERFREQKTWASEKLYELARSSGVSKSAIWEAAQGLPLKRRQERPQDGSPWFWVWTAEDGWPKSIETLETLKRCEGKSSDTKDIHSVSDIQGNRNDSDAYTDVRHSVSAFQNFNETKSEIPWDSDLGTPEQKQEAGDSRSGRGYAVCFGEIRLLEAM